MVWGYREDERSAAFQDERQALSGGYTEFQMEYWGRFEFDVRYCEGGHVIMLQPSAQAFIS
jgi:hypothetical protein